MARSESNDRRVISQSEILRLVTPEITGSVEQALARLFRTEKIDQWAGGNFIHTPDALTLFLRKCADAYDSNNKSFFVELGKAMRRKPPMSPIVESTPEVNSPRTFLLVGWAGIDFVESVLKKLHVREVDLLPFTDLKAYFRKGFLPLCFYSDAALCQLNNDVFGFRQISEGTMKQIRLRMGLKSPRNYSLVKRVEFQAPNQFIQYLREGNTFYAISVAD